MAMNSHNLFGLLLLLIFNGVESIIVKFESGYVQGYTINVNDVETNIFKAIPFASPPIGNKRFRLPEKPANWTGIRDGTKYSSACMTNSSITKSVQKNTSEDCLYLNVFADNRCSVYDPCPIIFLIHGGAFQGDSAIMFNETDIIHKYASDRFILVLSAYRLGIFGLMDLGEELEDAPYNLAIYDMIAALKWSQKELPKLGGNINDFNVVGYSSSGAALVTIMASPAISENLFTRALISSGCPRLMPHYSRSMSKAVLEKVNVSFFKKSHKSYY